MYRSLAAEQPKNDKEPCTFYSAVVILSRSQLKVKYFDLLDENRLIFVVLSGGFQILGRDFGVLF